MISKQEVQLPPGPEFEQHYSVKQVAEMWGLGVDATRRIFEHEEDVIKIVRAESLYKRRYVTMKIPVSVVRRVHHRLTTSRSCKVN